MDLKIVLDDFGIRVFLSFGHGNIDLRDQLF